MKETQAYVERVRRVNRNYQRLDLAVDEALTAVQPGQALLVRRIERDYEVERWEPYLRALWFPVEVQPSNILVVEQPMSQSCQPGQLLSIIGPVGAPLRFRQKLRNILLIAYNSTPEALLLMLSPLLKRGASVTLILMGAARSYDSSHLPEPVEVVRADDDLRWHDMVMTLGWADQVFATVSPGDEFRYFGAIMQLIRERRNDVPANFIFGVFQRQLPCGIGACHACMLNSRDGLKLQCLDGPAFDLTTLRLD